MQYIPTGSYDYDQFNIIIITEQVSKDYIEDGVYIMTCQKNVVSSMC